MQSHSVKNAEDFHTSLCFKINYVRSGATLNQHPALRWFLLSCSMFLSPEIRNTFKLVAAITLKTILSGFDVK